MNTATDQPVSGIASRLALSSIRFYQQNLSPHKGFVCAHRMLRGGESCSEFGHRAVSEVGVFKALVLLHGRILECRAAAKLMANRRFEEQLAEDAEAKRKRLAELEGPYPHWFEACTSWSGTPCLGPEIVSRCGW